MWLSLKIMASILPCLSDDHWSHFNLFVLWCARHTVGLYKHIHVHTYTRWERTCMHVGIHTHTHACTHARTHARTHTHTHTHNTHTHTNTHTNIFTHEKLTHTHTYTDTYAQPLTLHNMWTYENATRNDYILFTRSRYRQSIGILRSAQSTKYACRWWSMEAEGIIEAKVSKKEKKDEL